ncbi:MULTISPECIES: HIT family protein [unclassified Streptomyces]|uniref:HIT family protein n=1 Tax=unclassified Streptomyces TaxID=2593676 RepID=UPI0033F68DF2
MWPSSLTVVRRECSRCAGCSWTRRPADCRTSRTGRRPGQEQLREPLLHAGVNVFLADGEAADQTVFHLHVHVFPRTADDRFRLEVRWQERSRAALDHDAALIRARLDRGADRRGSS